MSNELTVQANRGLILVENNHANNLPVGLQKYVNAKNSEVISTLNPLQLELYMFDFITELILNVGHTKKAEDGFSVEQVSNSVSKFILDTHPTITKDELKLACLSYFIEKDNEQYTVSLKSVASAIRSYLNDELRKKAIMENNKLIDLVQIGKFSDEQKEQIILNGCLNCFDDYKENNLVVPVDYLCAVFYDFLKRKELINFTLERKVEIYDKALIIYKAGFNASKQINKDIYGSIIQTISNKKTSQENRSFVNLGKRIGLLMYFNDLLETGTELKELIT